MTYVNFETVPNQKIVCVHREELGNQFLGINKDTFIEAYKNLNATALALYLYFASNMNGYTFALSPKGIQDAFGMSKSTCQDQIKKLIDKGYLVPRRENSNIFDFYEHPKKEAIKPEGDHPKNGETLGLKEWQKAY